jgi:hypothetical protein
MRWATSILEVRLERYQPFGSENLDAKRAEPHRRYTEIS